MFSRSQNQRQSWQITDGWQWNYWLQVLFCTFNGPCLCSSHSQECDSLVFLWNDLQPIRHIPSLFIGAFQPPCWDRKAKIFSRPDFHNIFRHVAHLRKNWHKLKKGLSKASYVPLLALLFSSFVLSVDTVTHPDSSYEVWKVAAYL